MSDTARAKPISSVTTGDRKQKALRFTRKKPEVNYLRVNSFIPAFQYMIAQLRNKKVQIAGAIVKCRVNS